MKEAVFDTEATDLLNSSSIDYKASPYRLKDGFKMHCAVFINLHNIDDIVTFKPNELHKIEKYVKGLKRVVGHNIINYDLLMMKLYLGIDYSISPDSLAGNECKIDDTLIISKTLNPDRWFGHSIEAWGRQLKLEKIDWRSRAVELGLIDKKSPKGAEFKVYHPEMLDYCVRDAQVNTKVALVLEQEQERTGGDIWAAPFELEHKTVEIITRSSHRGFRFDQEKAKENLEYLDKEMAAIRAKVDPLIPPKTLTQAEVKEYSFPKLCFKKDGDVSSNLVKWLDKTPKAKLNKNSDGQVISIEWLGKVFKRKSLKESSHPFHEGPVLETLPATLKDGMHIKEWLVGLGWEPTVFKEKDLTVDSKKKKLSKEKFKAAAERYIIQTRHSNFAPFRLEHLNVSSFKELHDKILTHDMKKPLKVLTNPSFTIDQEKTLCPSLLRLNNIFPYAQDVVNWLTYNHRRNSILGGGYLMDEAEEAQSGFLSSPRIDQDGRIPTEADTLGAGTGRFKHRLVANIPRSTSLFGKQMRQMFCCAPDKYQLGSDFVSVEAMLEGHHTYRYAGGPEYAKTLTAEKPNSVHDVNARELSIKRPEAKVLKYSCTYGAQPFKISKQMGWTLFKSRKVYNDFWIAAAPLKALKDAVEKFWKTKGQRKFIIGLDGRRIYTRSQHALLNDLFQSSAAIVFKRMLVMFDEKLKEEGLLCDFFTEDWKNKVYVQLMIAYHDEVQLEMDKSLVRIKYFNSKEEANSYQANGFYLSNTGKDKGNNYYRAYSKVGKWIREVAQSVSDYYNLNVDLKMDYDIGKNWDDTH